MNKGSTFLIGLVIVVVVGAGGWFGYQALLPKLEEPWLQQLKSPVAYAGIQELTDGGMPAASGELYTSESEGFSVVAPGTPTVTTATETKSGLNLKQIQTVWRAGDSGYIVGSSDLSGYAVDVDVALDGAVSGMLAAVPGSTLRESERSTFLDEQSVTGVADLSDGDSLRFVVVFHKHWMYLIGASELDDNSDENFIASFKFLD